MRAVSALPERMVNLIEEAISVSIKMFKLVDTELSEDTLRRGTVVKVCWIRAGEAAFIWLRVLE